MKTLFAAAVVSYLIAVITCQAPLSEADGICLLVAFDERQTELLDFCRNLDITAILAMDVSLLL